MCCYCWCNYFVNVLIFIKFLGYFRGFFSLIYRFSLFLAWMTDRLHHYIRKLRLLRKSMDAVKKQSRSFDDEELTSLKAKVKKLESKCETKKKDVKAAEANTEALRKQSEGFLLEYDRLLEDNQNLREQLQSLDRGLSHSNSKKNP
ncbi:hypothetical protein MKW92_000863 [Papaver armeniacum]|nr:hypothetical protein MKW92_000863 [Papaver armeniacum]